MSENILISFLKRVEQAGGVLHWQAPSLREAWFLESYLLFSCENNEPPLVDLDEITMSQKPDPLGLIVQAKVTLLQRGKEILEEHGGE